VEEWFCSVAGSEGRLRLGAWRWGVSEITALLYPSSALVVPGASYYQDAPWTHTYMLYTSKPALLR